MQTKAIMALSRQAPTIKVVKITAIRTVSHSPLFPINQHLEKQAESKKKINHSIYDYHMHTYLLKDN